MKNKVDNSTYIRNCIRFFKAFLVTVLVLSFTSCKRDTQDVQPQILIQDTIPIIKPLVKEDTLINDSLYVVILSFIQRDSSSAKTWTNHSTTTFKVRHPISFKRLTIIKKRILYFPAGFLSNYDPVLNNFHKNYRINDTIPLTAFRLLDQ